MTKVWKTSMVIAAREFAKEAHKDTRYGNLPYEYHLCSVVQSLESHRWRTATGNWHPGHADEVLAAAWLHDVVEDTDVTIGDVREEFGGHVARLVDAVTDEPGENRKARKAGMYKKLSKAPVGARAIKLADRIANTRASIENPGLSKMYRDEFPEFIKKVGQDEENQELVMELFWLYIDSQLSAKTS